MHKTENRRTASVNCSAEEWRKQSTVFNLQDVEKYKYLINCAESFHSYLIAMNKSTVLQPLHVYPKV